MAGSRRTTILDIGGTPAFWESMGFGRENVTITLLNLQAFQVEGPVFKSVKGDACDLSQYANKSFDLVFSNSVIEHLFTADNQRKMASEAQRVGKSYYIQTPNYFFPMEPHWMFPFFQFLPFRFRVFLTRSFTLGHISRAKVDADAVMKVNEVRLLTPREMREMFPGGKMYKESILGLTKSITMYSFDKENGHA